MKNKSSKLNEKLKAVSRKLKASLSIPFKKLVPGLVLLSFVLSGILAPISLSNVASDSNKNVAVNISQNKVSANTLEPEASTDESGGRYGSGDNDDDGEDISSPFSCGVFGNSNLLGCVGHIVWGLILFQRRILLLWPDGYLT